MEATGNWAGPRSIVVGTWVWLVVAVVSFSNPEPGILFAFSILTAGAIGVVWLSGWIFAGELGITASRWRLLSWFSVPAALLIALAIHPTNWPLIARIWLSEGALKARAVRVLNEPEPTHDERYQRLFLPNEWVGLFEVRECFRCQGGGVGFQTWGPKGRGGGGIIYAPNGIPEPSKSSHLYGAWYSWETDD